MFIPLAASGAAVVVQLPAHFGESTRVPCAEKHLLCRLALDLVLPTATDRRRNLHDAVSPQAVVWDVIQIVTNIQQLVGNTKT